MSSRPPSDPPGAPFDDTEANNGGDFFAIRHDDPDHAGLPAQYAARIWARAGHEALQRMARSHALSRSPRPLTAEEKVILWEAVAPLLRDMEATGQALPDIRAEAHDDRGEDAVCAWIQEPGGHFGQGINVLRFCSQAVQRDFLAEQLQSWAADVQVGPQRRPWPGCPDHPGAHPLEPETHDDLALWCCPETFRVVSEIGSLGSPPPSGTPRFVHRDAV